MVNLVPVNDEREHVEDVWCWCRPRTYDFDPFSGLEYSRGPVVVHNSADCREVSERATGDTVTPGQGWTIITRD